MKFMLFMIPEVYQPGSSKKAGPGFTPDAESVAAMMKFNEEMAKAGILLGLDGLHPLTNGARVQFSGGKPKVTDGPFAEAKEVVGGYWLIQVNSKQEAIEWARRCPTKDNDTIEIRQVFEMSEFPEDVQKAADNRAVREQVEKIKGSQK